jgi:hypothetical protein
MRAYLREMQRIELPERSLSRLTKTSGTTADALLGVGSSLFDTEPDALEVVLNELADDDR